MRTLTIAISAAAMLLAGTAALAGSGKGMMPMTDLTRAEAQQQAEAHFGEMDLTKDGLLNQADREARMAQRFDRMDTDKNGSISRDEFLSGHKGRGHDQAGAGKSDAEGDHAGKRHHMGHSGGHRGGKHMMKAADTNNDGAISSAEFVTAKLARFDAADANKDGTVTVDEHKAGMQAMREQWKATHGAATNQ